MKKPLLILPALVLLISIGATAGNLLPSYNRKFYNILNGKGLPKNGTRWPVGKAQFGLEFLWEPDLMFFQKLDQWMGTRCSFGPIIPIATTCQSEATWVITKALIR